MPQGTSTVLIPFMVCIETIRTLAVRLTANIIAGHLLLTLLGNTGPSISTILLRLLIITQIALLVLESAVAIIHIYVFAVLRTLYSSEVILLLLINCNTAMIEMLSREGPFRKLTVNCSSSYCLMEGNHSQTTQGLFFTVILGVYFTILQAYEYIEAPIYNC
ncbi:ATP synthase subunit a [Lucilia cuprina]|nr:ATP synthase subunit a [Lucilia cuprina]